MCGIAGWLGALPDGGSYAARLAQALHHRGPDAYGTRSWPQATLVHTRLSIIDLSPAGTQPMANEDGTVWTVFNGEIYNHRTLRSELEARGHVFKGRSDTEVLPHLYEEEGMAFVTRLRGMFALAIYDVHSQTLVLARDRFGIKPLFYAPGKERLAFASEIRALLELPDIDDQPNKQAISDLVALFYIPAPETFYTGIRALQPGELLEVRRDANGISWKTQTYHQWTIAPDPTMSLNQAADCAETLMLDSVRRQTASDVPLGAFLSGGIDSSLVSVAAQEAMKGELRTFNVRFAEADYDETWAAQAVAKYIGSCHETLTMGNLEGTWEYVTHLLRHAGQPFADTSLFAAHAVCRLMRQHVKVALSGDGGDEGFGGYDLFWRIARIARWHRAPPRLRSGVAGALAVLSNFGIITEHLPQRIQHLNGGDDTSLIQSMWCWIREEDHAHLYRYPGVLPVRRLFEPQWEYHLPPGVSRVERLSAQATEVITRLTMPNDFLFKVDTASMRESLEVRVPMLDEDLFAFGLTLPHRLKVNGRTCKRVLRAVAERKLPPEVASKPKRGFAIPVDTWVDTAFKAGLRETLLGPSTKLPEYFHPKVYRPMVEAFCDGRPYGTISRQGLYQLATMLLSVEMALSAR